MDQSPMIIKTVLVSAALSQLAFPQPAPEATEPHDAMTASPAHIPASLPDTLDAAAGASGTKSHLEALTLPGKTVKPQPAPSPERPQLHQPAAVTRLQAAELKRGEGLYRPLPGSHHGRPRLEPLYHSPGKGR